jgi:hypothetical protein
VCYIIQVNLTALTGSQGIPAADTRSDFPVLMQVTAPPWRRAEEMSRAGVDIVVVLDSTRHWICNWVTEIEIFVNKLSSNDRLSLVLTGTNPRRLMELTFMTDQGRAFARSKIEEFCAPEVIRNIAAGLREGAEVYIYSLSNNKFI